MQAIVLNSMSSSGCFQYKTRSTITIGTTGMRNGPHRMSRAVLSTTAHAFSRECVVLGGGVGGLVTAAKLAQAGHNVTIVEQNEQLGGRCQTVTMAGCRFDTGPSLLLLPHVYKDTFNWLGSDISQHVQLSRVEPAAYRVWFEGSGGTLDLLYDVQQMVQQLEQVEPNSGWLLSYLLHAAQTCMNACRIAYGIMFLVCYNMLRA